MNRLIYSIRILLVSSLIALASCSSESPAADYAKGFSEMAAEIDRTSDNEQCRRMLTDGKTEWKTQLNSIVERNGSYKLTDSDRTLLKNAMKSYMEVSMKKSIEFGGSTSEGIEEMANSMLETIVFPKIDAAETLSDLAAPID